MKVVILAGGQRSTISNEQEGIQNRWRKSAVPMLAYMKVSLPMVLMNLLFAVVMVDMIRNTDYYIYQSDNTVDLQTNTIQIHKNRTED